MHDSLAISVANAVLSEPENSVLTRVYCRSLTHMQLSSSNKVGGRTHTCCTGEVKTSRLGASTKHLL